MTIGTLGHEAKDELANAYTPRYELDKPGGNHDCFAGSTHACAMDTWVSDRIADEQGYTVLRVVALLSVTKERQPVYLEPTHRTRPHRTA